MAKFKGKKVLAKGAGLGRRSAASSQAAPAVNPRNAGYADPRVANVVGPYPGGPDRSAYGPPDEDFGNKLPVPIGAVAQTPTAMKALAPRPVIDRFPIVVGSGLSFAYLSAQQRTCLTGYRQGYVDLLREILERDPHLYAVVWKPIRSISNGRLEITAAELPKGHPDFERANMIARDVAQRIRRIRGLKQSIATLGWGAYYGVAAAELHYVYDPTDHTVGPDGEKGGWFVDHLGFIHSRRLSYPDMGTWDLYVWDQGQVLSTTAFGNSPTNANIFGLRIADVPQKFIVYAPQISGDYPTREGSGRLVAEWALIKRAAARSALRYLEQFSKPIPEIKFNTSDPDAEGTAKAREATEEDIQAGESAANAIAQGALASFTHPDSLDLKLLTPEARNNKITFDKLLEVCNEEESKATVGSTLTTSVGAHGGNRALGEVHQAEEKNVFSFFADTMAEAMREQLITPLVLLNHEGAEHLVPQVKIHVEDEDSVARLKLATEAAKMNIPVDADLIADQIGLPVTPKPDDVPYRVMIPLDVTAPTDMYPELAPKPPSGTLAGAKLEIAKQKQAQKPPFGGASGGAGGQPAAKPASAPAKKVAASDHGDNPQKPSHVTAISVFKELEEDYPPDAIEWVLRYKWAGPVEVPLDEIDFSNAKSWRASKEPADVAYHTIKISEGHKKPVILVRTPKGKRFIVVDGHHRTLSYKHLEEPVTAFIADVDAERGEWDVMHDQQEGSSRQLKLTEEKLAQRAVDRSGPEFESALEEATVWLKAFSSGCSPASAT
jgi:hypothetical protein